jgi:RNA polymerase sigma-70 factor (sigma-E family)
MRRSISERAGVIQRSARLRLYRCPRRYSHLSAGRPDVPDTDAEFDEFVRARGPALIRAGYLLTGDQHLAEDLVQTALSRTYRAWHRLDRVGNAEAYTRKAMYHAQVSWWRRRGVRETLSAVLPDVATPGDDVDARLVLRAALLRLTPKQRTVLVLRFLEDRSESATAEILSVSVGTVKVHTRRALARLRELAPDLEDLLGATEGVPQ